MRNFINCLRGNLYKAAHGRLLLVHVLVPLIGILMFGGYFFISPLGEMDKIFVFVQAVAMAYPLMTAIVVSMLYEMDLKAGGFANMLIVPYSKVTVHMGNLFALLLLGLGACLLTFLGFGLVFWGLKYTGFGIKDYLLFAFMMIGANLAAYVIQYMVCFLFGKGVSLGVGIVGTLLSPLLYLGLGAQIWKFVPSSYGMRLFTYHFFLFRKIRSDDITGYSLENFQTGMYFVIGITLAVIAIFVVWSRFWQNTRTAEE